MKVFIVFLVFFIYGCGYSETKTFEIQTKSGEFIKINCPILDTSRSDLSSLYERECVLFK